MRLILGLSFSLLCCWAGPLDMVWQREYSHGANDRVNDLILLADESVVIVGTTDRDPGQAAFVMRVDSAGEELWRREYDWLNDAGFVRITQDRAGKIYLAGKRAERVNNRYHYSFYELELNGIGDTLWTEFWSDSLDSQILDVFPSERGAVNFVVKNKHGTRGMYKGGNQVDPRRLEGGRPLLRLNDGDWITGDETPVSEPWGDHDGVPETRYTIVQFFRHHSMGYLQDDGFYRCPALCDLTAMKALDDGGYIAVGDVDPHHWSYGNALLYFVRLDARLDTLWTRQYPDSGGGRLWGADDVVVRQNDSFLAVSSVPTNAPRWHDFYLAEVDSDGALLWDSTYGDGTFHVIKTIGKNDGSILLAGKKRPDADSSLGHVSLVRLK